MAENFDLLGDPIPENWGGRGRPQHIATQQNRNKVMLLLALNWTPPRIAAALGITAPTLRKNYFRELKFRDEARARAYGAMAQTLWEQARSGKVGAVKELLKLLDKADLETPVAPQPTKPARLGKKAQASEDAQDAHEGTGWGPLLN